MRWTFKLNNLTGYYSIKSAASGSISYYLAVKDDSPALDHQIVVRSATEASLTNGMKWRVQTTASGAYKIIPKTGEANDYVLATSTSLGTNNADLVQGDYILNNSYRDEWNVCMLAPDFTNVYIGVSDGDTAMSGILRTVNDHFNSNGYFGNNLNSSTKDELIYMLKESSVFSTITHGDQTSIRLKGSVYFSVDDVNSMGSSDLNNLVLVYLGACDTGMGGVSATNLVIWIATSILILTLSFVIVLCLQETHLLIFDIDLLYDLLN